MKHSTINVEFKDELKALQRKLSDMGAKNLNVRKNYNGDYEVSFSIKCIDAKSEITQIITSAGGKNITISDSFSGARFNYYIDDKCNEREIKKLIQDMLRRKNYISY